MRRLVLVLAVLLVNLPAAHQAWTGHRISRDGRDVEATVVHARTLDGRHLVDYQLPEDVDPAGTRFSARVDDAAYETARETGRLGVRVVPGRPGTHRADGEVGSPLLVVTAAGADVILVVVAGLWWWRRRVSTGSTTEG